MHPTTMYLSTRTPQVAPTQSKPPEQVANTQGIISKAQTNPRSYSNYFSMLKSPLYTTVPTSITKLAPPTTRSNYSMHQTTLYTKEPTNTTKLPPPTTKTHSSMHQTNLYATVPANIHKLPTTTARYHSTPTMPYNTNQSTKKAKNPTILTISHRTPSYPLQYIWDGAVSG